MKMMRRTTKMVEIAGRTMFAERNGIDRIFGKTLIVWLLAIVSMSCAAGPTPERVGFSYPEYGIQFNPKRHVVSRAMGAEIEPLHPDSFTLLFPRVTSNVEDENHRLLFSAVKGEWSGKDSPLFDDINTNYYGVDENYQFELTEEKTVKVPWPGLKIESGTLRVFHMTPLEGKSGTPQYTFAVTITHYGNTFEICWREATDVVPDQKKIDDFFNWTHGLKFFEPQKKSGGTS
jgi:hypothetical protein